MIGYTKGYKNKLFWCACGISLIFGMLLVILRGLNHE